MLPLGWIVLSVAAYFLQAVAVVLDKFLLSGRVQRPSTYAFWVGVFGLGAFVLLPFGFFVPASSVITNAVISGVAFTVGLFFLYGAIQAGEASRVAPIVGALSPIFTFLISRVVLGETLERGEFAAFAVLVVGGALAAFPLRRRAPHAANHYARIFLYAAVAAFLFAVTYVFEKAVFNGTPFVNGFMWTRIGGFLGALPFLVWSRSRNSIFAAPRMADRFTISAFLGNKVAGAVGFFLLSLAVARAPTVSLVNALQGVQYALIFLIALFLSRYLPAVIREEATTPVLIEKIAAIVLIGGGLALLAFFAR